jgi:hypothetical protein
MGDAGEVDSVPFGVTPTQADNKDKATMASTKILTRFIKTSFFSFLRLP